MNDASYPFSVKHLKKPNVFQRIFRIAPKENALIELNNHLAEGIMSTSLQDIEDISRRYRVDIWQRFPRQLQRFYRDYLWYCFSDHSLSEEEINALARLKQILGLNDHTVEKIHNQVAQIIFDESVDEALADGKLEEDEKQFLQELKKRLQLPDELAREIYQEKARDHLQACLDEAVSDQRLSPDEEEELMQIAINLGITPQLDDKTERVLQKFRLFWLIENGDIPAIDVDIKLQKNEVCYFTARADWYEYRRVTRRVRYGGPSVRIKVVKGVYWRMGDMGVRTLSDDELTHIDAGIIYLTNKRLIFIGRTQNKTIRLNKILDFNIYKNGVDIQKETGKSPFIKFKDNVDVFALILARLLSQS
ncbi:MAG TPA: hypothetical protein GX404_06295 [Syntrophomonadaceae bacterium]|nr:hypothetical protein [Syntrophomonadaceae bacterium]